MIATRITALVQDAPVIDGATIEELAAALVAVALGEVTARPARAALACAIEAVVDHLAAGMVDPGIALPALAMACATLADADAASLAVEAARFEVETLLPRPGTPRRGGPDVPLTALTRAIAAPPPALARRAARLGRVVDAVAASAEAHAAVGAARAALLAQPRTATTNLR